MEARPRKIKVYVRLNGRSPFEEWISSLRDTRTKARVFTRIDRMRFGNFGDYKSVEQGVFELRIPYGPGLRVYFGLIGADVVLLIGGGDKASQARDIRFAQRCWKEFQDG
jgi:putative addiction module killer protein